MKHSWMKMNLLYNRQGSFTVRQHDRSDNCSDILSEGSDICVETPYIFHVECPIPLTKCQIWQLLWHIVRSWFTVGQYVRDEIGYAAVLVCSYLICSCFRVIISYMQLFWKNHLVYAAGFTLSMQSCFHFISNMQLFWLISSRICSCFGVFFFIPNYSTLTFSCFNIYR